MSPLIYPSPTSKIFGTPLPRRYNLFGVVCGICDAKKFAQEKTPLSKGVVARKFERKNLESLFQKSLTLKDFFFGNARDNGNFFFRIISRKHGIYHFEASLVSCFNFGSGQAANQNKKEKPIQFMRDELLDVLKGLGIILVVFAHVNKGEPSQIIYLFHMPLFFFLGGAALIYSQPVGVILFVKKRLRSLAVPYILFSLISFAYWAFIEVKFRKAQSANVFSGFLGELDFRMQQFINIFTAFDMGSYNSFLYNAVLWFLPCMFVAAVTYHFICKLPKVWIPIVCALSALIYFLFLQHWVLPWCAEIALTTLPLFYLGEWLYPKIKKTSKRVDAVFGLSLVASIIAIVHFLHPRVNMMEHAFFDYKFFYIISVSLILLVIIIAKYLMLFRLGELTWLGKNSLIIMCLHEPLKRIVLKLSSFSGVDINCIRASFFGSCVIVMLTILLLVPIVLAMNKYVPFLVGKKKLT
jgi:fucose 4-O-acetylase-like acetyltransferase